MEDTLPWFSEYGYGYVTLPVFTVDDNCFFFQIHSDGYTIYCAKCQRSRWHKDGITCILTIVFFWLSKKPNDLKSQTHQVFFSFSFRVYNNCPLCNSQPVVQCVVCEHPLPLSACLLLLAAVMVVAATSAADLVLKLLYT